MRSMPVDDSALESVFWRLFTNSEHFTWQLAPAPPFASVDWARSKMLSDALLRTDADVVVMQDGDMGVPAEDYDYLAAKALELDAVVGSLLCKRGGGGMCGLVDLHAKFGSPISLYSDAEAELGEGEYNGAAFTAYPRSVLERLASVLPWTVPHGTRVDDPEACRDQGFWPFFYPELRQAELVWTPGRDEVGLRRCNGAAVYVTEDRAFCDVTRGRTPPLVPVHRQLGEHGERIWLSLKPRVAHWGSHPWYPHEAGKRPG
jgi:hypothetical protein